MKAETKKATMLDGKYREAVDGCRQLQDKYYDEEMPRILEVSFYIFLWKCFYQKSTKRIIKIWNKQDWKRRKLHFNRILNYKEAFLRKYYLLAIVWQ